MHAQESKRLIPLKDSLLPQPERRSIDFVAAHELPDVLQKSKAQIARLLTIEKIEIFGNAKNIRSYPFLNESSSCTILTFVDTCLTLSLSPQQSTHYRRPA